MSNLDKAEAVFGNAKAAKHFVWGAIQSLDREDVEINVIRGIAFVVGRNKEIDLRATLDAYVAAWRVCPNDAVVSRRYIEAGTYVSKIMRECGREVPLKMVA